MVCINGKSVNADGKSVSDYLAENNYDMKLVAVEKNGEIVPKAKYSDTLMNDEDVIEIVSFVGGG